ncbi:MAG TPA: NADH-quinone oxidoreductase subunit NuoN [Candidatus Avipropionibacterium avicola]|uniref:NADH-quinone oxidoreductase subunit N n=1 Tax=Candidatus Avipropionibacterium avicola TaxID=2840701 RepID=A0A9D1KMI7_9ACTN|nr:NADH-quinone oxidoreductase subunit NuoN [Candidatus Avipropionibacterium avicola]
MEISAPSLDYGLLAPVLIVFGAACVGVLLEALVPRGGRRLTQAILAFAALVAAMVMVGINASSGARVVEAVGSIAIDGPTQFLWGTLILLTAMALLVFLDRDVDDSHFAPSAASVPGSNQEQEAQEAGHAHTEVFPLALFALSGMLVFPAANDLITLFVALEVLSLPLYVLSGLARRRRLLSQESSLKYFLLGAMSSGFFLYGITLLYGFSGSFDYAGIADAVVNPTQPTGLLIAGLGLLGMGLLFKVGAVPFHSWTPDVYVGAPTPVTGFMAACTKIAAVGALLRVFFVALGSARWDWQPAMAVVAVMTMVVGALMAITQTDVKRMLAYSSIAHAGFILTAVVGAYQTGSGAPDGAVTSIQSVLFYLAVYGASTIAAFALLTMVRDRGIEATNLSDWAGLAKKSPRVAAAFGFLLLSFAGIPLTSGFIGKWAVFAAAWGGGYAWLVVVAVLVSLVTAFFYLKVIVSMFFAEPAESSEVVEPSIPTLLAVAVGVAVTFVAGVVPGPLLELAAKAGEFVR